jgi:hypothetical protein
MKTRQSGKGLADAVVTCELWSSAVALLLLVLTGLVFEWSINPISRPNPVYSHTHTHHNNMRPLAEKVLVHKRDHRTDFRISIDLESYSRVVGFASRPRNRPFRFRFFVQFLRISRQMRREFLDYAKIASFRILPSSSFIRHPNIQCYWQRREKNSLISKDKERFFCTFRKKR